MDDIAKAAFEAAKEILSKSITGLEHVTWEQLPEPVKEYIKAHPTANAITIVAALIPFMPWLAISAAGMTGYGPAAATFATWCQSTYGTTAAFRFIQSAAMGGWAAPVVKTAAMGVSVALAGAAEWCKWRGNGTNTS